MVPCTPHSTVLECVLFYQGVEESYDTLVTGYFQPLGEGKVAVPCTSQRSDLEGVLFYQGVEKSYDATITEDF